MNAGYAELNTADRVVARFLSEYHKNWQNNFPGLNKRAHWHVIFSARLAGKDGVSCRTIHRALYGSYGTDIRTCVERIHDCEQDGFVRVFDAAARPCVASAGCLIGATDQLRECFDRHCRATIDELRAACGEGERRFPPPIRCDDDKVSAIFQFFHAYDEKWRETAETVVRQKQLTPAFHNDAMDHLVTYQYWAIAMLLWSASQFGSDSTGSPALVVDEVYFHCGKALIRSDLWNPDKHLARGDFPSLGRILADQIGGIDVAEAERQTAESYRDRLY